MLTKTIVVLIAISCMPMVLSRGRNFSKSQANSLSKARCDLMCFERPKELRSQVSVQTVSYNNLLWPSRKPATNMYMLESRAATMIQ